ncbi:hypothetical protein [Stakelama tenebrarum]|uniref:Uncharacterized protein n=1 Tax=Stakelama tenebrarum TaxID=2711215 RepID=A0A6G6Y4F2_9SPHN|nr:hypothetical protein [Sphingosinithalassobacter tenebrarum]QIG79780.1 hypothetical protein G5C33_08250 [Sphingosinithalassobacter tenebrarum]
MGALTDRLNAAASGFAITVAPLVVVAIAQLVFMPQILAVAEGLESNEQARLVSIWRAEFSIAHTIVAILFVIYWLLVAVLGKGQILRCKSANRILAFCVVAYLTITLYSIFLWPDGLRVVCPFLGISDTIANPYACDAMSSCDVFADVASQLILLGLLGLIVPFIISLIVRIVSSRRACQRQDDTPPSLVE